MSGASLIYFYTLLCRKHKDILSGPHIYIAARVDVNTSNLTRCVSESGTVEICATCNGCLILQIVLESAAVLM